MLGLRPRLKTLTPMSILLHTTELRHHLRRKLLAAWWEIYGTRAQMTPETAWELAPLAAGTTPRELKSAAETLLETEHASLPKRRKAELARQAWWAHRWRDPRGPYAIVPLDLEQEVLKSKLLHEIDPRCFPSADPDQIAVCPDAVVVCEVIALHGQMLTTASLRTIDRVEINRWTHANADRLGFKKQGAVFSTDTTMAEWTTSPYDLERWIQAGLLACWPPAWDHSPARKIIRSTVAEIRAMLNARDCKLPTAGARLINGLENHPDPVGLVDETRRLLPSKTISCERAHPACSPADPWAARHPAAANAPAAPALRKRPGEAGRTRTSRLEP